LSQVDLKKILSLLKIFAKERENRIEVILLGGLALQHYGMQDRATIDVDAEVSVDLEKLFQFLKANQIPSDLSENISGWSVVAMPPGYRDRAITIYQNPCLRVAVLCPLDFIISKLRRFTEEDIHDALFIVKKFSILPEEIERAAHEAICHSVKDTALFLFQSNVRLFLNKTILWG